MHAKQIVDVDPKCDALTLIERRDLHCAQLAAEVDKLGIPLGAADGLELREPHLALRVGVDAKELQGSE